MEEIKVTEKIAMVKSKVDGEKYPVLKMALVDGVPVMWKFCTACGTYKPLENFSESSTGYAKKHTYCRKCVSLKNKQNYVDRNKSTVEVTADVVSEKPSRPKTIAEGVSLLTSKQKLIEELAQAKKTENFLSAVVSVLVKRDPNLYLSISLDELESAGEIAIDFDPTNAKDAVIIDVA